MTTNIYMSKDTIKVEFKRLNEQIIDIKKLLADSRVENKEIKDNMQKLILKIQEIETKNNMLSNLFANNKMIIIAIVFIAFITGNEQLISVLFKIFGG